MPPSRLPARRVSLGAMTQQIDVLVRRETHLALEQAEAIGGPGDGYRSADLAPRRSVLRIGWAKPPPAANECAPELSAMCCRE
jgi:hypothetical protein